MGAPFNSAFITIAGMLFFFGAPLFLLYALFH